jgi:hypothetical protein
VFERGIEVLFGESGRVAFSITPVVRRSACGNWTVASAPTLRIVHAGAARHIVVRDWRKELSHALHRARALIDAWRLSDHADAANAITHAAKERTLRGRLADERRAVGVLGGFDRASR